MAKVTRVFQQQFLVNGNASHCGQFGSKAVGSPVNTLDPNTIQSLSAFTTDGWFDAVVGSNKQPFLEDMNGLFRVIFYQLCSMFQDGIPAWDPSTPYYTGSIVRVDGTSQIYGSLVDNNVGNTPPNQTNNAYWQYLSPQSVPTGQLAAFPGPLTTGYLACDGTAYVDATWPALSTYMAGATVWRTFNGAADPGVGNFRTPDLRSLTLMGAGQGTGFSARTLGQLVGEESHVLDIGEMPPHNHGVDDPEHGHEDYATGPAAQITNGGTGQNTMGRATLGNANVQPSATGISIQTTGGGGAHNNMQPTVGVNWGIKT